MCFTFLSPFFTITFIMLPSPKRVCKHVWQDEEVHKLVDFLHKNEHYQYALLPGRNPPGKDTGNKVKKATLFRQIHKTLWPNDSRYTGAEQHLRAKINSLNTTYHAELSKMKQTEQGLLYDQLVPCSNLKTQREHLKQHLLWWETWHEMCINRTEAEPAQVLVSDGYGPELDDSDDNTDRSKSPAPYTRRDMDLDDAVKKISPSPKLLSL